MIVEGKIWGPYQAFYIQSMLFNCVSAIRSIARVGAIFEKVPEEVTEEDLASLPVHTILNELQNIVVQGAALSRYFWPVREGHKERGKILREAFGIRDTSPLKERDIRNAIEHFDERLDNYLASGVVGYIFPEFVGPRPVEDGIPGHFFRAYFIDCGVFRLLDDEYKIEPLMAEIFRIDEMLQEADANGDVLPSA